LHPWHHHLDHLLDKPHKYKRPSNRRNPLLLRPNLWLERQAKMDPTVVMVLLFHLRRVGREEEHSNVVEEAAMQRVVLHLALQFHKPCQQRLKQTSQQTRIDHPEPRIRLLR
jgi:hypothetical protein